MSRPHPKYEGRRISHDRRVFFIEEPIFGNSSMRLEVRETDCGVYVVVPHLPNGLRSNIAITAVMKEMTYRLFLDHAIDEYVFWYYTPMALSYTSHFTPIAAVYDCMDELSAFKDAPSELSTFEKELFGRVDLVFTGGQTLDEAKRNQHRAVYAFPSSIDASHFGKARTAQPAPPDQANIPHPRLGFFGVIDERFDRDLLDQVCHEILHADILVTYNSPDKVFIRANLLFSIYASLRRVLSNSQESLREG